MPGFMRAWCCEVVLIFIFDKLCRYILVDWLVEVAVMKVCVSLQSNTGIISESYMIVMTMVLFYLFYIFLQF